ncbi:9112_t:CDS:10 [Ambispora gerdemannii]|uniref:9112_t:CDS:1 n=1 Tax=Ambispora gerdemannii TaxID=144530 RepID=A0A9N9ANZ7_9GLOM|nr:9112_t:CDS:10 [Ambispora gerdemannii]
MSLHKKKAKLAQVTEDEVVDEKANETFIIYGTLLPEVDSTSSEDKGKFQPIWKQEVRDENGLRRFHGAFKGGWSAGYYNTVGSKEGWIPSTFVSSRSNRSAKKESLPQDFMDDEDLEELGQNQKLVTTEEFDLLGSTEREKAQKQALAASFNENRSGFSAISERLIEDLVVPSKEPVGVRLLKKMGWRQGQGIGPHSAIIKFDHKDNTYGLGFDPYKNAPEFASKVKSNSKVEQSHLQTANSLPMKGGIGVGALEEEDDEDIYDTTSIREYRTLLIDEDEEAIFVGKRQDKKPQTFVSSKKKSSSMQLCYDGSEPLTGFVLAQRPLPLNKWQVFTPPEIPTGFVPIHYFDTPGPAETQNTSSMPSNTHQKVTTLAIVADQRAAKLGENPIQAPARSVFDFVSRRDKERLDNLIGAYVEVKTEDVQHAKFVIPKVEKDVATAALKGFIPFGDNLSKQTRYKQFLEYQAGLSQVELRLPEDYTADEFSKELDDFAKAARIFRPMSSMIASRFASASPSSIIQEFKQPEGGLRAPSGKKSFQEVSTTATTTSTTVFEDSRSAAEAAAKMNMFGALTRTRAEFYPNRLLCKRFNIANPHPEHKGDSSTGKTQKGQQQPLSKEKVDEIMQERSTQSFVNNTNNGSSATSTQTITQSESLQEKDPEESKPDSENKETVAINYVRPSMDIFKAIFESESDSESEQEETSKKKVPPNLVSHPIDAPKPDESISVQVASNVAVSSSSPIIKQEKSETSFRPMFIPKSDRANDRTLVSSTSSPFKSSESVQKDHVSTAGPLSFLDDIPQTESNHKRSSLRDESKTTDVKEKKTISSPVKETKPTIENIANDSTRNHEELRISRQHISKKQKRDDSDDEYTRRRHKNHKKSTSSKQRSSASKKHKKQEDSNSDHSQTSSSESSSNEVVRRRHKNKTKRHKKEYSSSKKKSKKHSGPKPHRPRAMDYWD